MAKVLLSNMMKININCKTSIVRHVSKFNIPPTGSEQPRPAGICSMMRLPVQTTSQGLDACFVGVPLDSGTCNRPGARFGPRQIRQESCFVRPYNLATGAQPFDSLTIADLGDLNVNMYDLPQAVKDIRQGISNIIKDGCRPLTIGGDHTISYPILQAIRDKWGAVGLIHVDAHDDTADSMFGAKIAHGTPFYHASEEGCLQGGKVVQIGLRGSGDGPHDWDYARSKGFRMVPAEECWYKSLTPLMESVRQQMGAAPVYLTFDIDSLDPAYAPGTGTPEVGGLTTIQALEIIRGCRGLNIVGCDLVEVSPPYDPSGNTSLIAANLLFEMCCILPGVKHLHGYTNTNIK